MLITLTLQIRQQKSKILNNLLKTVQLITIHMGFVVKQLTLQSLFLSSMLMAIAASFCFENIFLSRTGRHNFPSHYYG